MNKTISTIITLFFLIGCNDSRKETNHEVQKEKPFTQSYYQCEKERGGTSTGISSCLEEELKHQDSKLNSAYQKAKNGIQPFRVESLKKLQREWISYRDEKCAFFNHFRECQTTLSTQTEPKTTKISTLFI